MIKTSEWKILNSESLKAKKEAKLPIDKEIKWSDLWLIRKGLKSKNRTFLNNYKYDDLLNYFEAILNIFNSLSYRLIVFTVADNRSVGKVGEHQMLKLHIQNILQRIQKELEVDKNNLGIVFIDSMGPQKDKVLKNMCHSLLNSGDFFISYNNLKNGINVEYSHHCLGIQLADLSAGIFFSFLKSFKRQGYDTSVDFFYKYIEQNIRKYNGEIFGYGIVDVPNRAEFRQRLKEWYYDIPF